MKAPGKRSLGAAPVNRWDCREKVERRRATLVRGIGLLAAAGYQLLA